MGKSWTERGGFSSYGKTALTAKMELCGFDELFQKISSLEKNVNEACKKAVDSATPIIRNDMEQGAERHRRTGAVVDNIEALRAKAQGDYIFAEVGIDLAKHPEAFEGVFQEYGDGHSPCFPDPFVRPAVEKNRKEIRKIMRQTLKKEGMPFG